MREVIYQKQKKVPVQAFGSNIIRLFTVHNLQFMLYSAVKFKKQLTIVFILLQFEP